MSAAPPPESRPATAEEAGRTCPYCRFSFKQGAPLSLCPACHAAHHEECWSDNHGCAIVGCTATPPPWMTRTRIDEQRALAQPAPPPPPAFATTMAGTTATPPPQYASAPQGSRRLTPLVAVVIVGALAAAGAAAAVVATKKSPGSAAANANQQTLTLPAPAPTPDDTTTDTAPAPAPQPSPATQKRAVVTVLHRYEAAYSGHDIDGLRAIMQPSVTRHGLRGGGCSDTTGRATVLQTYAEQFALGTGAYTLHGLYSSAVNLSGSHATVPLTYSIGGGGTGSVRFDLRRFSVGWRISRIDASC